MLLQTEKMSRSVVDGLSQAQRLLDAEMDRRYSREVSPMVFYIGSTGLLPDEFEAEAHTAEELEKKHPHLMIQKMSKMAPSSSLTNIISVFMKDEVVNRA